ncbi:MAG: hypothetical protein WC325_10635 [Candidatus Bathyarchaeia archaeon]|jgi:uncharacterized membrane protein
MQTITQKKKLSKGTWVLIFVAIAALITIAVLAAVGIVDLGFLTADYDMETGTSGLLVGYAVFGSNGWVNATIIILIPFVFGVIASWVVTRYFVGQKVTAPTIYTPQTGASSTQTSGTTTEVSS